MNRTGLRTRILAGLLAPLLTGVGCAALQPGDAPDCPVVPVASHELPRPLLLRTRLSLAAREHELRIESVAQTSDGGLVVVGFAPHGVRLFALQQRGRKLEAESLAAEELAMPALWTADLLHRVYWIQSPQPAAPDGPTRWFREGEQVTEWRAAGRLVRREFAVAEGGSGASERVTIEYPGSGPRDTGSAITVRNPWCGYQAVVVTLDD